MVWQDANLSQYMHWIYACVAGGLFGFGLGAFGDTVLTYVIDSNRFVSSMVPFPPFKTNKF